MPFRTWLPRLALVAACLSPMAALDMAPARAETVADKPRLIVSLAGQKEFLDVLKTKLTGTRRFDLVERANVKDTLKKRQITLDSKLTVQKSLQAMAVAGADLVLDGKVDNAAGGLRITSRLYDFRTGEITRDLSLIGQAGDTEVLAGQLAAFVRHSIPLRCLIKDITEDQVVLDLGAMDGVVDGSAFKVFRYPHNLKPYEIGLIRVLRADPFAATAEVESTKTGFKLEQGDRLVEQTAGYVLSQ